MNGACSFAGKRKPFLVIHFAGPNRCVNYKFKQFSEKKYMRK